MAHIVTEKCNGCKFTDCVEVCPVACLYEMENQVVIHPDECIDCMACVEVCPVHAIYADMDLPPEFERTSSSLMSSRSRSRNRARRQSQLGRIHCPALASESRPGVTERRAGGP